MLLLAEAFARALLVDIHGWLRSMLQFKFVAYVIVMSDVHT